MTIITTTHHLTVVPAGPQHDTALRQILVEQREWLEGALGHDVASFQPLATVEYADPVGYYRKRGGQLLLALDGDHPAGVLGVCPIDDGIGELKRMYVRPTARGRGAGLALLQAAIGAATASGLSELVLETKLPEMTPAARLYGSVGFSEHPDPPPGPSWMDGRLYMHRPLV